MSGEQFFNALLALTALVAFGTLFGVAMIWAALKFGGGGKVRTAANNGVSRREIGQRSSVTKQTQIVQTNSTSQKPPVSPGRIAQ